MSHQLACHLCLGTLDEPDVAHSGPRKDAPDLFIHLADAGFTGVQGGDAAAAQAAGFAWTSLVAIRQRKDAHDALAAERDRGARLISVHAGTGMEDDARALRLLEAIVRAGDDLGVIPAVETHRATITQDFARTVVFVRHLPELRFTGDLSHWYCGQEMVYGDWEEKLAFIAPVLERVRLIHGRIADPGCIQAEDVSDPHASYVAHFRQLWRLTAAGFRRTAPAGSTLIFAPELLPRRIFYARAARLPDGSMRERHDRWADALRLCSYARGSWAADLTEPPP